MAGLFNQSVMTLKGLALLAKAQAESAAINITRIAAGNGEYENGEDLTGLEDLKSEKQTFAPDSVIRVNDTNVNVRATFTNYPHGIPLETGYRITEVGVFAEDPDDGEILYSIAISEEPDYMPSYNGMVPSLVPVTFLIEVANADDVTMTVDLDLYVTKRDLDYSSATDEEVEELANELMGESGDPSGGGSTATDEDIEDLIEDLDDL